MPQACLQLWHVAQSPFISNINLFPASRLIATQWVQSSRVNSCNFSFNLRY